MATQVISVLKVAGSTGEWAWGRLQDWAAARQADGAGTWAAEQWPPEVRREADRLADRLRSHATVPPIVHFVEWADSWSMGDTVVRWLTPKRGPAAVRVYGDRYELFGYFLPDDGVLVGHLVDDGPHQHTEGGWLVRRLREAAESWDELYDRAALVVLRRVTAPSVTDEELAESLKAVPAWLSGSVNGSR